MKGILKLQDGSEYIGKSFGYERPVSGEVVFSTGMVGYPESLTDPSYIGQILILTYPLVGNYGVPDQKYWESGHMQISALIVSDYIDTPSHHKSKMTLSNWLKKERVPALEIKDTRELVIKIREKGAMLGKILLNKDDDWKIDFYDPNKENLLVKASPNNITSEGNGKKKLLLIDCGGKRNLNRNLLQRDVTIRTIPWDHDPFDPSSGGSFDFDALIVSNGPGDPKFATKTIETVRKALEQRIPTFGVCLGHQILCLAAGGDTYKLKYGHRGQNQPAILTGTNKCYLTTQNHGFAVGKIPKGFKQWFTNANDQTNEGIIHAKYPFMSVQFHPEVTPGPMDTEWLFDYFLEKI